MKYAQEVELSNGRLVIPYDWFPGELPANMQADGMVYFDTSFSFTSFYSGKPGALQIGYASGNYGRSALITGINGMLKIGKYVILESTNIICNESITIGDHCMFSWGSVVTDSWIANIPADARKKMLERVSSSENRYLEYDVTKPVAIEDNVWVGFDAVILPGVKLGKGCVIGSKTVVSEDVPPYAVVVGSPPRIVKFLEADDTPEEKESAIVKYTHSRKSK